MRFPDVLYRYRPVGSSLAFLLQELKGWLWCSYAENLNDPFDGLSGVQRQSTSLRIEPGGHVIEVPFRCGVACFTERWDSATMWTHYASQGAGVCVGYSTVKLLAAVESYNSENSSQDTKDVDPVKQLTVAKLAPVEYGTDLSTSKTDGQSRQIDAAFMKSDEWQYESEWRLVCNTVEPNAMPPGGVHFFPGDCLHEVLLGKHIDMATRFAIEGALKQRGGQQGTKVPMTIVYPDSKTRRYQRSAEMRMDEAGHWVAPVTG